MESSREEGVDSALNLSVSLHCSEPWFSHLYEGSKKAQITGSYGLNKNSGRVWLWHLMSLCP